MEGVWSAESTTPAEVEAALRDLLKERHAEHQSYVPARVLNLVVIVDGEWRGEIANRLDRVGRYHPSRTVLCAVEPRRDTLTARVVTSTDVDPRPGVLAVAKERVELRIGREHLSHLDTIVDPLVVPDLVTAVWSPHGHWEAVDALRRLSQVVLLDSLDEPDPVTAIRRAKRLAEDRYVVDLAWLRSTPWRERISATFDPPAMRGELRSISAITVRHRPDSGVAGLLLFGWLAARLGWEPGAMMPAGGDGSMRGRARARRLEVSLRLEPNAQQSVPGLSGLTIETASGASLTLDRGEGGLRARRVARDGRASEWTLLGASRGEAGILGEGIRQVLLRDSTYRPALTCAEAMLA